MIFIFCSLFLFHVYLCYAVLSVPCSLVITCRETTDLLAFLCVRFLEFLSFSHMVFQVRYGTCLYQCLIFTCLSTLSLTVRTCRHNFGLLARNFKFWPLKFFDLSNKYFTFYLEVSQRSSLIFDHLYHSVSLRRHELLTTYFTS